MLVKSWHVKFRTEIMPRQRERVAGAGIVYVKVCMRGDVCQLSIFLFPSHEMRRTRLFHLWVPVARSGAWCGTGSGMCMYTWIYARVEKVSETYCIASGKNVYCI